MSEDKSIVIVAESELHKLKKKYPQAHVLDEIELIQYELFRFYNPSMSSLDSEFASKLSEFRSKMFEQSNPVVETYWVYFPWQNTIAHIPDEETLYCLRTCRNQNLITSQEQHTLKKSTIGIAGLSVGSSAVKALAHEGARKLRLADHDHVSITNLNRLQAGLSNIGQEKIDWITQILYELDPYFDLCCFREGVTDQNIEGFIQGLDVLVDEIDDVSMKAKLRMLARERGVPVVMATDNGDNVLLDVERYDLDSSLPIFHGNLSEKEVEILLNQELTSDETARFALKIINPDYTTARLLESVAEIGVTLSGVPQLGSTAMSAGDLVATVARKVVTGADVKSGKIEIDLEHALSTDQGKEEHNRSRVTARENFNA